MALADDDRNALVVRLAPAGSAVADAVAAVLGDDEQLRDALATGGGAVLVLTDERALLLAAGAAPASFGYGDVSLHRKTSGLGISASVEGDRLVLDVPRSTYDRLALIAQHAAPRRATWLPHRTPPPAPPVARSMPTPPAGMSPLPVPPPGAPSLPPPPPGTPPLPLPPPPTVDRPAPAVPPGWHPDPSGTHWWRWWDGRDWTAHVADGGGAHLDPLPPR